jgi:hypothetical protein
VARHGLRPVVDAVGAAARELLEADIPVLDEYHEPMDKGDVETAADNLCHGDLLLDTRLSSSTIFGKEPNHAKNRIRC